MIIGQKDPDVLETPLKQAFKEMGTSSNGPAAVSSAPVPGLYRNSALSDPPASNSSTSRLTSPGYVVFGGIRGRLFTRDASDV
jgi:hypothetical protein